VRCGRCGNENSEGNRFCGMCGASLVAKPQAAAPATVNGGGRQSEAVADGFSAGARVPARPAREAVSAPAGPVATRPPATAPTATALAAPTVATPAPIAPAPPENGEPGLSDPVISGPSFLGLNKPSDGRYGEPMRARANFGRRDSYHSDNVDYLLDDEEEPRRGWGKLVVVVIALALIGGFGYLRWKQGGFNFLKPAPAQSATDSPGAAASNPVSASPNAPAEKQSSENQNAANPAPASATPPNQDSSNPSATPDAAAGSAPPTPAAGGASGAEPGAERAVPANPTPGQNTPADTTSQAKPQDQDNTPDENATESDSAKEPKGEPSKPEPRARVAEAKPSAAQALRERKPTPVTPVDTTAEAERYIYGRGVAQDCDRGLRLLKPAAAQANPKAMMTLGSLYSGGTCTPRDLPTAYRWFALALHKQPDNQALQDNLQKLWSQMTQPERQLAIKLSQ
jgi:TPR repeat protein